MVGRRVQLDFLIEHSRAVAQRHGSLVFVGGDSGSGKTRLLSELCAKLDDQALRQVEGRCFEYAQAPFGPIIAAIRTLFQDDPDLVPGSLAARTILSRLIPELSDAPPVAPTLDASEKLHHFEVLASVLRRAAEKKPTILIIEDLHWADAATTELLEHIARAVKAMALCIIASYRGEGLPRGHPLRVLLARVEREPAFWRLELGPLNDDEMQTFIAETLGDRASITPEMALAIRTKSEGSPLFAEELLRSALGSPKRNAIADLPRSLREAVLEQLNQLSDLDRRLLISASAIGRRFSADFLARIVDLPVAQVLPGLKRALDLQLIAQVDDGAMEFRHALTREAVYSELLEAEARPLHATIARAIEASPMAAQSVTELAYQWWSARDPAKAGAYNERAGDEAEAVHASQDATISFERALEAIAQDDPRRAAVQRKLAAALYRSGLGARAQVAYEACIEAFLRDGSLEEAAPALVDLARLHWTVGNAGGHLDATRRALEIIGERDANPAWFAARVEMAWAQAQRGGDPDEALRLLAQAATRKVNAPLRDQIKFHECRSLVHILRASTREALADAEDASTLALGAKDVASAVRCWGNVGMLAAQCGEQSVSNGAFARAVELIDRERPFGWPAPWALALHAYAQFLYGQLPEAEATIERALSAILDVPSLDAIVAWVALPLGLRRENHALVERCADEELVEFAFRSGSTLIGGVASAFAEYYLAHDRTADANALLARALETLRAHPTPGDYDATLVMIAQHCDRDRVARVRALIDQMATTTHVRSAPAYAALIAAWEAKRFGDEDEAINLGLKAASAFETLGWPMYQAQALEVAGRPSDAALIFRAMGDRANLRRLEEIVTPPNRRGRRKEELSAREQEIAQLVIASKSNREIADVLVVSERTVESHISSILRKMQITSRRQLVDRLKASSTSASNSSERARH